MSQQWQFDQDDQAQWRWKRLDEEHGNLDSPGAFPKEIDCILDAVRHAVQRRRSLSDTGRDGLLP